MRSSVLLHSRLRQWVIIIGIIISHCPCVHCWMYQCTTNTKHIEAIFLLHKRYQWVTRRTLSSLSSIAVCKYIQILYWILCAFLSQLTRTTNLDLHFNGQVNERTIVRARVQKIDDFDFNFLVFALRHIGIQWCVFMWNSHCELSVSPNEIKKKYGRIANSYTFTQYSHFYSLKLVLFWNFFFFRSLLISLVRLLSCHFSVLNFSLR